MLYNETVYYKRGRLAQLVEHLLDVQRVKGSSPLSSTKLLNWEVVYCVC